MRPYFFILIACFALDLCGQDELNLPYSGKYLWTKREWRSANTAWFSLYMSKQTRECIRFMNLSRMYGEKFANIYLDSMPNKNRYVESLIATLKKREPALPLRPSPNLWGSAVSHAIISGFKGAYGHGGFDTRMLIFQPFSFGNITGENCDYGHKNGLDIALSLLIDKGVPSLGHRYNILNPDFSRIGGARFPHKTYEWNAVFNYASPKWLDLIFYRKPDSKQYGINLDMSQISATPMAGIGATYLANHIKTNYMLADVNYHKGLFKNNLQAISASLAYGSSTGMFNKFLIGTKVSTYFPEKEINVYLQPTISYFAIISLFRNGYLYEINDAKRSALYRISYGYNFCLTGNRNDMVLRHNITANRFICVKSDGEKRKRKRR